MCLSIRTLCKNYVPENSHMLKYFNANKTQGGHESHSVMSGSLRSHDLYSPSDSPGQSIGVGSLSLLQGIFPTQGSNPALLVLQADSLPAEPQGKLKNAGWGSLSLLQQIFPTQELNPGLLHCRWFLYQPSYQRSPQTW